MVINMKFRTIYVVRNSNAEKGNVLFLILIAVALFAALSYAVTQSSRSGGTSATSEKADLAAAQFSQYGAQIAMAIMRLKVSNGCSETQISFENPIMSHPDYWGGSANTTAPSDGRCNVFGPNGGGVVYWDIRKQFPNEDPVYNYLNFTPRLGIKDVGTGASELVMYFRMDWSDQAKKICSSYNNKMGITGDTTSGTTNTNDWHFAMGNGLSYEAAPIDTLTIGDDPTPSAFAGQTTGCLTGSSSHNGDSQMLYYVVMAR
ncbi:MAG: hypothetical protein DI586_00195 [Micavibrio aeruginosavorus]|uniref:Uncharacterized protein n=1 Tax=Micavibrio aeruginosavorus TaxID=349221 RepID=A0A2W5FUM2_9BACT|nr:MAG: hypothetical protein DI586_00195 [Micavibrio aeruginosavorus]